MWKPNMGTWNGMMTMSLIASSFKGLIAVAVIIIGVKVVKKAFFPTETKGIEQPSAQDKPTVIGTTEEAEL